LEGSTPSTFIDQLSSQQLTWTDLDVIAGHYTKERAGIIIIHVRRGRLVGKTPYIVDIKEKISSKQDYFQILVQQHYLRPDLPLPAEIIPEQPLPEDLNQSLQSALKEKQAVCIRSASEDDKTAGLLRIAKKNIELLIRQKEEYEQYLLEQNITAERQRAMALGLEELKDVLELEDLPMIIEAFDMSNTQGTDPVGSMVTFVEGVPSKSHYRRFKIRSKATPDDVGMMREVLTRRYSKLMDQKDQMPDLIVVDGGKGQLNMADEVLRSLGLQEIPHIGLAKREEEIITVGSEDSILLAKDSPALHVLQALRDEAHRFALTYHRLLRKKRQTKSELDDIPNVGEARRNKLLQFFGSVEEIKKASELEIANIVGTAVASTVFSYFATKKAEPTSRVALNEKSPIRKKTTKKAALQLIKDEKRRKDRKKT
jgi:excinuclease ABC subunit C